MGSDGKIDYVKSFSATIVTGTPFHAPQNFQISNSFALRKARSASVNSTSTSSSGSISSSAISSGSTAALTCRDSPHPGSSARASASRRRLRRNRLRRRPSPLSLPGEAMRRQDALSLSATLEGRNAAAAADAAIIAAAVESLPPSGQQIVPQVGDDAAMADEFDPGSLSLPPSPPYTKDPASKRSSTATLPHESDLLAAAAVAAAAAATGQAGVMGASAGRLGCALRCASDGGRDGETADHSVPQATPCLVPPSTLSHLSNSQRHSGRHLAHHAQDLSPRLGLHLTAATLPPAAASSGASLASVRATAALAALPQSNTLEQLTGFLAGDRRPQTLPLWLHLPDQDEQQHRRHQQQPQIPFPPCQRHRSGYSQQLQQGRHQQQQQQQELHQDYTYRGTSEQLKRPEEGGKEWRHERDYDEHIQYKHAALDATVEREGGSAACADGSRHVLPLLGEGMRTADLLGGAGHEGRVSRRADLGELDDTLMLGRAAGDEGAAAGDVVGHGVQASAQCLQGSPRLTRQGVDGRQGFRLAAGMVGPPALPLGRQGGGVVRGGSSSDSMGEPWRVELSLRCLRGPSRGVSDVIGTLDFEARDGDLFATGGIARKVRVYSLRSLRRRAEQTRSEVGRGRGGGGRHLRTGSLAGVMDTLDDLHDEDDEDDDDEMGRSCWTLQGDRDMDESKDVASDEDDDEDGCRSWRKRSRGSGQTSMASSVQRGGQGGMGVGAGSFGRKRKASSTSDLVALCYGADEGGERGEVDGPVPSVKRQTVLDSDDSVLTTLCNAAKLSSVRWVPHALGTIGCGDYDGVFTEWDVETGMCVAERDEHHGQRVWSLSYSRDSPCGMSATSSDDGTVRLWAAAQESSIGCISRHAGGGGGGGSGVGGGGGACSPTSSSPVCSAEFSPDGRLLAAGGADSLVRVYDLRQLHEPLAVLQGHSRTVSYVRFMGASHVVSASIDSTVKLWDLDGVPDTLRHAPPCQVPSPAKPPASASCHSNRRNFVGLAVSASGLIASGSETNEVVTYRHEAVGNRLSPHMRFDFLTCKFRQGPQAEVGMYPPVSPATAGRALSDTNSTRALRSPRLPFVSAVSWQEVDGKGDLCLGAANSAGIVNILTA